MNGYLWIIYMSVRIRNNGGALFISFTRLSGVDK